MMLPILLINLMQESCQHPETVDNLSYSPLIGGSLRDRLNTIDPQRLAKMSKVLAILAGIAVWSISGTSEASADTLNVYNEQDSTSNLLRSIMEKTGEIIQNFSEFLNPSDVVEHSIQAPIEPGGFADDVWNKVVVDGAEAVMNIYEVGVERPRLSAGLIAGGVHALFRIKELGYFLKNGYESIVDPTIDWHPDPNKTPDPTKVSWKKRIGDAANPLNLVKAYIIPSHFLDSFFTMLTVANFQPTPANFLNIAMLGTKYKITDVGYKNMMKMEDLIKEKKALEEVGQTLSNYWTVAAVDFAVDAVLFFNWLRGEKDLE